MGQQGAIGRAEDERALPAMPSELVQGLLAERDLTRPAVFRRVDDAFRHSLANDKSPGVEVDVDPAKAD
jgi:hypothetical protein